MFTPHVKDNKVQIGTTFAEDLVRKYGSPLYVYDAQKIRRRYLDLVRNITYPKLKIHYACKANTNIEILKLLKDQGAYIETVSPGEVLAALKAGFTTDETIFTCSNISKEEMAWLIEKNITINLDSLTQLERYGQLKANGKVSIRINQGIGAGHHEHVITGGPDSKFGIDITQLDEAKAIAKKYNLTFVGIHQHIGSNVLDEHIFMQALEKLLETAFQFPDLEFIDFGGGFGIAYRPEEKELDIESLGQLITRSFERFSNKYGRQLTMRFEAGRYLVAESGMLLVSVTDIKTTPYKTFVGVDSGFNHLIRPAMYDSYHHVVNASCVEGVTQSVTLAGNVCESGDVFAKDREIANVKEGDVLAILNTGAYGFAMSSNYNSRPRPAEVLVGGDETRIIRERETFEQIIR